MKGLSRESRFLIDAAREGDEPSAADRKRVRAALARKLAVGAAAGVVAATATHAAAGGVTSGAAAGTAAASAGAVAGVGAGVAAGAGGVAAGAASATAGAIVTGLGAKILVTVAIVGAMSAGTVGYVRHESAKREAAQSIVARAAAPSAPVVKSASRPAYVAASPPVAPVPVVPAPVAPPAAPLPADPVIARSLSAPKPVAPAAPAPVAAAPAPSDLDVELALLQQAHGAIQANDGARALRLLDERARRFPDGALAEESEAARVFALRQVGRTDEARDLAARFLREHPRSPLAPRVAHTFDSDPSTF